MDSDTCLPKCAGFDSGGVLSYEDVSFIPTKTIVDAVETAKLFIQDVLSLHGFPKTIDSNRDSKLPQSSGSIRSSPSRCSFGSVPSFHLETNEQTERLTGHWRLCSYIV